MCRTPLPRGKIGFFRFFLREEGGGGRKSIHRLVEGETREWGMMGWKGWEVGVLKGWEMGEIGGNYATMFNISQSK